MCNNNTCVCCGDIIPEGIMVCWKCEHEILNEGERKQLIVKKGFGKIYGAEFTTAEKKAIEMEIKRQMADYDSKHMLEIDALILWQLHEQFKFGPINLKRFFDGFSDSMDALSKRYELENEDKIWLCTKQLKDYGVDLEKWQEDRKEKLLL